MKQMNRSKISLLAFAFAAASGLGCGGSTDFDASQLHGASKITVGDDAPRSRLYFDVTNTVPVAAEAVGTFDLVAGARVELEVVTTNGSPLRYELLRVRNDGTTELINAFHIDSGFSLTTFTASSDGLFMLHFPQMDAPRDVVVHMECKGDGARCSPSMQPGQSCMFGRDCDDGLLCYPPVGTCTTGWVSGTCVVAQRASACDGQSDPVCGCDGKTYASTCLASVSSVGVVKAGACDAIVESTPPAQVDLH